MYYDKANSHPLDLNVFFVNIPTSTQSMELDGEMYFVLILTKINICLRWRMMTNLSMKMMSHLLTICLKVLLLLGSQRPLPRLYNEMITLSSHYLCLILIWVMEVLLTS